MGNMCCGEGRHNNKSALILQQAVEFEEKELQKRVSNVLNRVENLLVPDLGVNNYGRPFSECKKKSLNSNYYTNEIEILKGNNLIKSFSLGKRILRSETAAIASLVLFNNLIN